MATKKSILALQREVKKHYKKEGRHTLPWRVVQTPYTVFISECMLQQTPVDRVIPKFKTFARAFPSFSLLGNAGLSEVYARWQGLGYNRRAKYVRDAAKILSEKYGGVLPKSKEDLMRLPGVGPYTAGAILAFAYGNPDAFVETNIRTAVIYHVYPKKKNVPDVAILRVLEKIKPAKGKAAKEWYAALMDYGTHLKRSGVKLNHKSAGYVKQKAFKGSQREVRGAVIREIHKTSLTAAALYKKLPFEKTNIKNVLKNLNSEGLIACRRGRWFVAK